jgi:2-hydroxychromene-2-carboxylate isomerase
MTFEFWFEFASTYSYPAALRIEALARSQGVPIVWKPFLLGPIFRTLGWSDSPFNLQPVKGRYMWRDLERICAELSIPFHRPSQFPRNGLLAARIACWFEGKPWVPEFVRSVYRANFAEDLDISDSSLLESYLNKLGQPGAALIQQAQSPESKEKLRARTERAVTLGIFGAPTFVVGHELFWGNDRLEAALSWYKSHQQACAVKQLT